MLLFDRAACKQCIDKICCVFADGHRDLSIIASVSCAESQDGFVVCRHVFFHSDIPFSSEVARMDGDPLQFGVKHFYPSWIDMDFKQQT